MSKFIKLLTVATSITLLLPFSLYANESSNGYDPVTFDSSISVQAKLNSSGQVVVNWSKYSHSEGFSYYKVVRSQTVSNPVYPDNGYIYFTSDLNTLTYTDSEVPTGTNYYRVCEIASPKRYCSKTVIKITKGESQTTVQEEKTEEKPTFTPSSVLNGVYTDVPQGHFAESCIKQLNEQKILSSSSTSFRPEASVNRAEFVKMIIQSYLTESSDNSHCFSDVNNSDWFSNPVCVAKKHGVISGYTGNRFYPASSITRAEAASILVKLFGITSESSNSSNFSDVQADWQKDVVAKSVNAGIFKGYNDQKFGPNDSLTRAQAAQIICNSQRKNYTVSEVVKTTDTTETTSSSTAQPSSTSSTSSNSKAIIVNHLNTNIDSIPSNFINSAKEKFKIAYGHTSHGSQITTGMSVLEAINSVYSFSADGSNGSLYYNENLIYGDLGSSGDTTWANSTRELLNKDKSINLVVWSWCGGVSGNDESGINKYLTTMNALESEYPNVKFVYMTGHLDGSGVNGTLNKNNELIRNYVKENNKILFDFADIESYNPDGDYFLDQAATDSNDYGNGKNWATEWCSKNTNSPLCKANSCAHSQSLNCNLKGRAFWYLLAELAGYQQ